MYSTLAEGGNTPIVISEGGNDKSGFGGGGVLVILLFLIVIAVVAIPFFSRREPIANNDSILGSILPAMMIMQSSAQRQTVDVNSHNTDYGAGCGPSNFQLYQQGVATNDNVFVQSCQTREKIDDDGNATRTLINNNRMHDLELTIAQNNARIISLENKLESERQFNSIATQNTSNFNSLQAQIYSLASQVPRAPIPSYCVSPFGPYHAGFVNTFRENDCHGGCERRI